VLALLAMGTNDRALTVILIVMLPGVWALTRLFWSEQMFSAHEVWVDREGITGQTVRGETRILWSEVARAAWKPVGGVMGLEIKADNPRRQLRIRLATGLKESEQLFLAIIRRLRAQGYSQPLVLPVMVSDDPSVLDRPTASSGRQTGVQRAYLNTLPEPARRRLSGLWYLQVGLVITGLFIGAVIPIILDPVARLSWKLHAVGAPGVRFFVTISSLPLAVPAIILCSAVFAMLGSLIGYRWSGPHRKEWRRVQTIGSTRKTNIVAAILVGVVGVGTAVLVVVLVNSYIRVSDDGIAVRRLGALQEQRYGWSDVRRVNINSRYVYSKNGGHDKITYTITFSDGSDWSAKDPSILSVKEPELQKMLSYVAEKGHMKVEREYSGD